MFLLKISRYTQSYRSYSSKLLQYSDYKEHSATTIRNNFLDYFIKDHDHKFIRSSPVTPFCDPTVPFVNAGMNQFKNVFLGKSKAPCDKAVNSQKCIRISGKHNDLDIIGTDGYHHTFFEMLGNWSFGDYYKERACKLAWNLLTERYKIDSKRLYVTYFGGDKLLALEPDYECRDIWRSIGVPDNHILPFGCEQNFWEMGLSGPCGPCTEIHIDHLPDANSQNRAKLVNAGVSDLTELWNIVFIEYNRKLDGTLEALHEKYVDTGMGFERLVAVLQGKTSNYDTDLFVPIFDAISKESKITPYVGVYDETDSRYEIDYAYRVLADHARMCSICIADGMYPQTNNRLRKVLRRTFKICEDIFKSDHLLQTAVLPEIVNTLGHVYPELDKKFDLIKEVLSLENEHYKSLRVKNRQEFQSLNLSPDSVFSEEDTIDYAGFTNGFRDVEKLLSSDSTIKCLPIDFAYERLHIGFGLSEELIEKMAIEKTLSIDMEDFNQYKQEQKLKAKLNSCKLDNSFLNSIIEIDVPMTDYSNMYNYKFDAVLKEYIVEPITANIQMIQANDDGLYHIILNKTNFYHTAGGQEGDVGKIIGANGTEFIVESVNIHRGHVIHSGRFKKQTTTVFDVKSEVELHVDSSNRTLLSQHHTTMHLLQAAIKQVTKRIVFQQSSHVTSNELKCDLGSIGRRIDINEISKIEELVRNVIEAKVPIETQFLMAHELYALDDVTIIPGEIYPDENIRVLTIKNPANNFISIEPCCGTHAHNTNDLEDFCITGFKFNASSRTYDVAAIAGKSVAIAKKNEEDFLEKFQLFKSKIDQTQSADEWKMIEKEANDLSKELSTFQMPYVTKANAMNQMEEFKKKIRVAQKNQLRTNILSEMTDVLTKRAENNESFIVHVLNTSEALEESLMSDAERVCHDLPVIILNVSDNKIFHGRASIPIKYTTNKFNAKHWIEEIGQLLNITSQSNKKRKQFAISKFIDIPNKEFSPKELKHALDKAKAVAQQAFDEVVSSDEQNRNLSEENLITRIKNLKERLVNEKELSNLIEMKAQSDDIKNHMKNTLFLYTTRLQCVAELSKIDEQICDERGNAEIDLVSQRLSNVSTDNPTYIVVSIKTEHSLISMMQATDLRENIPMVIINISKDEVIGRVSIPLKYTNDNFQAKHLGDEFNKKFDGKCIHDGTRYNNSVCDFRLTAKLVNEEELDNIFKKVEQLIQKCLNK